jgi:DNA mismatch repair ATPase MutL
MKSLKKITQLTDSDSYQIIAYSLFHSYSRVIEELVYNAIDSKATQIEIRIDCEKLDIQIKDNGKQLFLLLIFCLCC